MYCAKVCFILLHVLTTLGWSYPISAADDDDEALSATRYSYEIYERLKSGDQQAWEEAGPYVVDLVNRMIENGEAKSPVHALLRLFWPELTAEEQTETLAKVEPLLRSLYKDLWKINNDDNLVAPGHVRSNSRLRKRSRGTSTTTIRLYNNDSE